LRRMIVREGIAGRSGPAIKRERELGGKKDRGGVAISDKEESHSDVIFTDNLRNQG